METVYADLKGKQIYRDIQRNLMEASKHYLSCTKQPLTGKSLQNFHTSLEKLFKLISPIQQEQLQYQTENEIKINFITNLPSVQNYNTIEVNPKVRYNLHPTAEFSPKICLQSNGLDIPLQEDEIFAPYELKKVDLKIRFQFPKNHCALLINKSSARLKYEVNVQLGLIDIGYHNYVAAVIQNMTEKEIILKKGTAVAQLLLIKAKIPKFTNEWPETNSTRGGFGSTGQIFERTITNNIVQDSVQFLSEEIMKDENDFLKIEDYLGPRKIGINSLAINLISTPIDRAHQTFELQEFENALLEKISPTLQSKLPTIQLSQSNLKNQDKEERIQSRETKLTEPYITEQEVSALLAADLSMNRKLTVESFQYFQNMDPVISAIKENLVGKNTLPAYTMKKGIVCKIFKETESQEPRQVIYIPTSLLIPTIIYIHKHFLHPARSQTYKQFIETYYHPQARRAIQRICKACIVCSATKNVEYKNIPVGRERTFTPTQPREAISADIMYLPRSSKGHTHALVIADLYSLYISFIPMKSKSAEATASALRNYISFMGVPKVLLTDNDPTFRSEVTTLLASFNIQHQTSFPYMQRGNTVESQVRKFLNAARAAIADSPIAKHTEWHVLYPLIIVRLNTLVSKYGLSREYVHFQQILETHLPLIIDIKLDQDIEDDLTQTSHKFRGAIQKFLKNKKKAKLSYPDKKSYDFALHELVMRKEYTPSTPLKPTYIGPYRIMELFPQGSLLKDPRTGEQMSVHFANMRKLSMDEFITLLPTHFDADILKTLGLFRYNRKGNPESIKKAEEAEIIKQDTLSEGEQDERQEPDNRSSTSNTEEFSPQAARILRSGRKINISVNTLPSKYSGATKAQWKTLPVPCQPTTITKKPSTKRIATIKTPNTPYYVEEQLLEQDSFLFSTSIELSVNKIKPEKNYKTRYKSSFQSDRKGILYINLPPEEDSNKKVRFSRLEIKFY
jgi:dUTPase